MTHSVIVTVNEVKAVERTHRLVEFASFLLKIRAVKGELSVETKVFTQQDASLNQ